VPIPYGEGSELIGIKTPLHLFMVRSHFLLLK
jgi:hypothetical protein